MAALIKGAKAVSYDHLEDLKYPLKTNSEVQAPSDSAPPPHLRSPALPSWSLSSEEDAARTTAEHDIEWDPSARLERPAKEASSILAQRLSQKIERKFILDVWDEITATTTDCMENIRHECLLDVDQYLDDQANHLPFLPAGSAHHPVIRFDLELDILGAPHSNHRVDHITRLLRKLDSQIEEIPIEDDSSSDDVLVEPFPVFPWELPIRGDVIEQELGTRDDLERSTSAHFIINDTEQNPTSSNFVEYRPPRPRSLLVLCNVDKAGTSFILQVLALFAIGFTVMLIYAIKKHDLGTGTGLCALIWTAGGVARATYRKVFPPDEDDSSGRELELREVSRHAA
jgi:hypothetical protein